MTTDLATLPPGVYKGLTFAEYQQIDAVNNSLLNHMMKSAAHAWHYKNHGSPETEAMVIGNALHAAILEPHTFLGRYAEGLDKPRRSNADKEAHAKHAEEHAGKIILPPDAFHSVIDISTTVKAHPLAGPFLDKLMPGMAEVTVVWIDEATGVKCKARVDAICDVPGKGAIVVDLKSTTDPTARAFERSIYNFGYHRQAAFYRAGLAANHMPTVEHMIIAFEKQPPYGLITYKIKPEAIEFGATQLNTLLLNYQECAELGRWPGYPETVQEIGLPRWATYEMENC